MSTLEISLGATPRVTDLPAGTPPSTPALAAGAGIVPGAALGGLLLGYGARIAYGCNIGAYFSGIASSSLHGWIWGITAFAGSILGTHLSFRRRLIARPPPAAPPLSLPPGEPGRGMALPRARDRASARNEDQSLSGDETSRVPPNRPKAATSARLAS